jgi:hypothetical protein
MVVLRGSELSFADFVDKDRFDLNSYLIYLFNQCKDNFPDVLENEDDKNRRKLKG